MTRSAGPFHVEEDVDPASMNSGCWLMAGKYPLYHYHRNQMEDAHKNVEQINDGILRWLKTKKGQSWMKSNSIKGASPDGGK